MIRKFTASLLFAALASGSLQAAEDPGDIGKEVIAHDVGMPVKDTGLISLKMCNTCHPTDIATLPNTIYEIGDVQVRREDMRSALALHPNQVMLFQFTPDRKFVARLKIAATPR